MPTTIPIAPGYYFHWTVKDRLSSSPGPRRFGCTPGCGRKLPKRGVWLRVSNPKMCRRGLHASPTPMKAAYCAVGVCIEVTDSPTLHMVKLSADLQTRNPGSGGEKAVASHRCIVKSIPWNKLPKSVQATFGDYPYSDDTQRAGRAALRALAKIKGVKVPPIPLKPGPKLITLHK